MERVLVTGGTGFIGSELVPKLKASGYEVEILKHYDGKYRRSREDGYVVHHASLTDYSTINKIVKASQPDYVVHLAAIVPFTYDRYVEVGETNYVGTVNLAEACHRNSKNFKQFVFAGTSEEYGNTLKDGKGVLTEESDLNPSSPYGVSKVACELYLRYMQKAYNFPFTAIRSYNTYGRKSRSHYFIESTISQMLDQGEVKLGDPTAVRDWLFVDDSVDGYLRALGNEKAIGETIQLCTGKAYTTKETAELIAKLTNFRNRILWNSTPKRPLDTHALRGDNSKARRLLGWKPKTSLSEGLRKTMGYLKSNKA